MGFGRFLSYERVRADPVVAYATSIMEVPWKGCAFPFCHPPLVIGRKEISGNLKDPARNFIRGRHRKSKALLRERKDWKSKHEFRIRDSDTDWAQGVMLRAFHFFIGCFCAV